MKNVKKGQKEILIVVILLVIIVIVVYWLYFKGSSSEAGEQDPQQQAEISTPETGNIVEITTSGFVPNEITIKAGESVTFINKEFLASWPASAVHPTHTVYPGSSIQKCGTVEETNIFDACKTLAKGESYIFTFNEKGSWSYHDHLNPSLRGKVTVE